MKKCSKCKCDLTEEVRILSKAQKDGIHRYCKSCHLKSMEAGKRKSYLKRIHNISLEQYGFLFQNQLGRCLICKTHQSDLDKVLCVDHDHRTGRIRGLLCNDCNRALGLFKDDKTILQNAVDYLNGSIA